jgi:hypothetical protein
VPYPQARTRPAHTPHAHTPTRARVGVCIHRHHSTHAVARTNARRTRSWRLRHTPVWRTVPPARPPPVWPCTSRWRRPTHGGTCHDFRWPAVGRQGSTRLRRYSSSAPEGGGRGAAGQRQEGGVSATTRATTTYTQSHKQSYMWLGVCTRHAAPAARHTHTYTHVAYPDDAVPAGAHTPGPHATRTYTHTRTCRCVHIHTAAHTQWPVLMHAGRAAGGCVTPLSGGPSRPPAHLQCGRARPAGGVPHTEGVVTTPAGQLSAVRAPRD